MPDIKSNEREFQGQVVGWLNEAISKGAYSFDEATQETSLKVSPKKTKFPDVAIWLNRAAGMGFCGWELKTPKTPADDKELLDNAAEKARAMGADYFVTWNMREAIIWRTPHKEETVSNENRAKTYPPLYPITKADDLWISPKQELLKRRASDVLYDLSTLQKEGHLHLVDIDSTFFVHILSDAAKTLAPFINHSLIKKIGKSKKFKDELFDWAVKQCIANYGDPSFYQAVSRQIVYRLLGKILFYLTLRRYRSDLPIMNLENIKPSKIGAKLKEYFEIARQIDYQAVFEEDVTDSVPFSGLAATPLKNLIVDLNRYNFSSMPQDVIGNVFEKLIPPEERHDLGQYFTKEELVDFINAFCIQTVDSKVIDPTCGTGTFLIRAYNKLKTNGLKSHTKLLSRLWGFDVAHFPAELATINLFRQNLEDYRNFPKIVSKDFFKVKPGDTFEFPPPKATGDDSFRIKEILPEFDAAVGNFPYIRQELIEKRIKGYKKILIKSLAEGWSKEYPELFTNGDIKLSGQADIYAYLFFHTARLLKEDGGRMGIVTSNSWLDVAYGYELQKFFLKNFTIVAILESRCEPWFEEAAVNTVVTILERTQNKKEKSDHLVKFVKIRKRLKDLIPWDMKMEAMNRWMGLDRLVHKIERAGSENYQLKGEKFENAQRGLATYEDEDFRIRTVKQSELLASLEATGKTDKWGRYLRAPDIYFEILEKCKDKLVPLKEVAEVRFGIKTGINEFFYLNQDKIKHWKVEKEFLAPVIKSPKEAKGLILRSKEVSHKVFLCHKTKIELRKQKQFGALKYIEWGEKQSNKDGIAWPNISTVSGRQLWYNIGIRVPGKLLLQMITNDRFFAPYNSDNVHVDHNLFEAFPKNHGYSFGLGIFVNSSLSALFRELISRVNLGEGATKTEGIDWKELSIPKIEILKKLDKQKEILKPIQKRAIKPIFEEVKMKDRQKLDGLVLEAIGLDPKKYLKPLYDGICELVRERIDLAAMRKKNKKIKSFYF